MDSSGDYNYNYYALCIALGTLYKMTVIIIIRELRREEVIIPANN